MMCSTTTTPQVPECTKQLVKLLKDVACRARAAAALATLTIENPTNCREVAQPQCIEHLLKLLKV